MGTWPSAIASVVWLELFAEKTYAAYIPLLATFVVIAHLYIFYRSCIIRYKISRI